MHKLLTVTLAIMLAASVRAESVANPADQCPILISQVETRLQSSPPQDEESVAQARQLLTEATQAQQEGDFRTCMSKIRRAFKFLNKT